ncbi:MAG: cyclic nucleotide-binding domain-containing protein, partial [Thermomicrobiales bacterium]|nr:cyclic nucleotide-binding domain-containing protein [Thermomicrobiales bacterium]
GLFAGERPGRIYHLPNRNGVSVVVLRTDALEPAELTELMKYRLAQYAAVDFVDTGMIAAEQLEHEPLSSVTPRDIHVIAGSVETGEILCYAVLKAPPEMPPGVTLRMRDRPLFPVEKVHGWGIFNRLPLLPDFPASKLLELGRFVKNQRLPALDELGVRAPIEVGIALFRTLSGPLSLEVEAIIGDLEEGVAKQNLEFFHVPLIVIHGTVPYEAEASYFFPRYQYCTVYPFAAASTDISTAMIARLQAVEDALEVPGKRGLLALLALKKDIQKPRSSFEPREGLSALTDAQVPQRDVAMATRRQILDLAAHLQTTDPFNGLTVSEAAVLGTFLQREAVAEGEYIVRQGETGDALYLIESGEADVRVRTLAGDVMTVATLRAGDYFGEIALVSGEKRTADVVAVTPMSVLRLDKDAYSRYLAKIVEVDQTLSRTAARRAGDTVNKILSGRSDA